MNDAAAVEILTTHTVAAPRGLVYDVWTRADHLDRWWGPRGFQTITESFDLRPGGEWRFVMKHPEHGEFPNRVRYVDVVPGERLAYEHDSGIDDDPKGFSVTVTFTEREGRTEVALLCRLRSAEAAAEARKFGAEKGGAETLERMAEHIEAESAIDLVITRTLRAPRALVWRAWTEPERLMHWWGPKGLDVEVTHLDLRPGGVFHYSMTGAAGTPMAGKMWGKFVYRAVDPTSRIVWVNSFSDEHMGITRHPLAPTWPAEVHNTLTLTEQEGGTLLTLRGRPINASPEERAIFAQNHPSMQAGFGGTFEQLEAYLREG